MRRRILPYLLALGCVLNGACCAQKEASAPTPVVVTAPYPGASPADVEALVAIPLESTLAATPGLQRMESTVVPDRAWIALWFDDTVPVEEHELAVRARLDEAAATLPDDATSPFVVLGAERARTPLAFAVTDADGWGPEAVLADGLLHEIERLPGVQRCRVDGARQERIEVTVDPIRSVQLGVGLNALGSALGAGPLLRDVRSIEEIGAAVVADQPVLLRDVATIALSSRSTETVLLDGEPAALLSPVARPDADLEALVADLRDAVTRVRSSWPAGIEVTELAPDAFDLQLVLDGPRDDEATLASLEQTRALAPDLGGPQELVLLGLDPGVPWFDETAPGQALMAWDWADDPPGDVRARVLDSVLATPGLAIRYLGLSGDHTITVTLTGDDRERLQATASEWAPDLALIEGVHGCWSGPSSTRPEIDVHLDREQMARLGIATAAAARVVHAATDGTELATVHDGEQRLPVIVRWGSVERPEDLRDLPVPLPAASGAGFVPLSAIADLELVAEPTLLRRVDASPAIALTLVVGAGQEKAVRKALETAAPVDLAEGVTVSIDPGR